MKVKMYQILGFNKVVDSLASQKLPLQLAYKLAKFKSGVSSEVEFYQQRVKQCIELYAERDENDKIIFVDEGKSVKLQPDKVDECNNKIRELEEMDVDVPNIKLTLAEFGAVEISLPEMECLLPFLTE